MSYKSFNKIAVLLFVLMSDLNPTFGHCTLIVVFISVVCLHCAPEAGLYSCVWMSHTDCERGQTLAHPSRPVAVTL